MKNLRNILITAFATIIKNLQAENVTVLAIEQVEQAYLLDEFTLDATKKYALVFGNELHGVSETAQLHADQKIKIRLLSFFKKQSKFEIYFYSVQTFFHPATTHW